MGTSRLLITDRFQPNSASSRTPSATASSRVRNSRRQATAPSALRYLATTLPGCPSLPQANGVVVDALQGRPEPAAGSRRHLPELRLTVGLELAPRLPGAAGQLVGDRSRLKPLVAKQQAADQAEGVIPSGARGQPRPPPPHHRRGELFQVTRRGLLAGQELREPPQLKPRPLRRVVGGPAVRRAPGGEQRRQRRPHRRRDRKLREVVLPAPALAVMVADHQAALPARAQVLRPGVAAGRQRCPAPAPAHEAPARDRPMPSTSWMPPDSRATRANTASSSGIGAAIGSGAPASIDRRFKSATGARYRSTVVSREACPSNCWTMNHGSPYSCRKSRRSSAVRPYFWSISTLSTTSMYSAKLCLAECGVA